MLAGSLRQQVGLARLCLAKTWDGNCWDGDGGCWHKELQGKASASTLLSWKASKEGEKKKRVKKQINKK